MASERSIAEITNSENEFYRKYKSGIKSDLRVAMPGIIQSFNSEEQTVTVQPALRENVIQSDYSKEWTQLPLLLDVPIVIPRAGDFVLTMVPKQGDECLIIFGDMCYDAWWSYGGIQNQIEARRHDLSDAMAILGVYSQPNIISNYSTTSAQLRSIEGNTIIDIKDSAISIKSPSITITGATTINGKSY